MQVGALKSLGPTGKLPGWRNGFSRMVLRTVVYGRGVLVTDSKACRGGTPVDRDAAPRRRGRFYRWGVVFFQAVAATLVALLALEGVARLYWRARPEPKNSWVDVLTPGAKQDGYYFLAMHELPVPVEPPRSPELKAPRDPDVFRVATFGASAVYGTPYPPDAAFPHMLLRILKAQWPLGKFEVCNFGSAGRNYYFGLETVRDAMALKPDCMILDAGAGGLYPNNIYFSARRALRPFGNWLDPNGWLLCTSSAARWAVSAMQRGDDVANPAAPPPIPPNFDFPAHVPDVYRDFEWITGRIVAFARASDAKLVYLVPLRNLRDFPPEPGVEFSPPLTAPEARAIEARPSRMPPDAFLLARHYEAAGDTARAKALYCEASDGSYFFGRATSRLVQFVRELPGRYRDVAVVDVEPELERESAGGVIGDDWLVDASHFRLETHFRVARALARELEPLVTQRFGPPTGDAPAFSELVNQLTPNVEQMLMDGIEYSGFWNFVAQRWKRAADFYEERLKLGYSLNSALGLGMCRVQLGDLAEARAMADRIRATSSEQDIAQAIAGQAGLARSFYEQYLRASEAHE